MNKSLNVVEVMNEINRVMQHFPNSYINLSFEVILLPKTNAYFGVKNCESVLDVRYYTLVRTCRDCFKTQYYKYLKANKKMWKKNLNCLNNALGTNFSTEDVQLIYARLGNGINENLGKKFVESGYNMELLKG